MPHGDALRQVCEYALMLPERLPNFTCEQTTARYIADKPVDVVTAIVSYDSGKESYREIKSNRTAPSNPDVLNAAAWSTGQFGGDVQSLFLPGNHVSFQFANEREIEGRQILTFQYRITHQDFPVWRLHWKDQVTAPPVHGQLRIDAQKATLLRLVVAASELPRSFPMRTADVDIKYDNVAFGDGTSFVLPVESVVNGVDRNGTRTRNELRFEKCQKFRATAHIVPQ
ncbi:MAG TPA: hypothetical protein VFB04_02000 [Terriglobales bacterium]|nr:hypothetical protein [Terriglobales bacterium]